VSARSQYWEAVKYEQQVRDSSFVSSEEVIHTHVKRFGIWFPVCLTVQSMTVRHWLLLEDNALMPGNIKDKEASNIESDLAMFLWVLSPNFSTEKRKRLKFLKQVAKLNLTQTITGVTLYISQTFLDAPGGNTNAIEASYTSQASDIIDLLASQYGWSLNEIMSLSLKQVFQLTRSIRQRLNPTEHKLINRISDGLKLAALKEQTELDKKAKEEKENGTS
jgi:hypothetical protein